jgi:hypothetical protein
MVTVALCMRTKRDGSSVVPTLIVAGDVVVHTVLAFWHAAVVVPADTGGLGWQLALAAATLILQSRSRSLVCKFGLFVLALDSSTSEAVTLSGFLSVSGCL